MSAHACELCHAPHSYDNICDDCVRKHHDLRRDLSLYRAMARYRQKRIDDERAFARVAITFWRAVAASMVKP